MGRSNIQRTNCKSETSQKEQNSKQDFRKDISDSHLIETTKVAINDLLRRFRKNIELMSEEEAIAIAKRVLEPVKTFVNALPMMKKSKEILFLWLLDNKEAPIDVDTKISSLKSSLNQQVCTPESGDFHKNLV